MHLTHAHIGIYTAISLFRPATLGRPEPKSPNRHLEHAAAHVQQHWHLATTAGRIHRLHASAGVLKNFDTSVNFSSTHAFGLRTLAGCCSALNSIYCVLFRARRMAKLFSGIVSVLALVGWVVYLAGIGSATNLCTKASGSWLAETLGRSQTFESLTSTIWYIRIYIYIPVSESYHTCTCA